LEKEIRAQFEAFRQTGIPMDHVNAHNHMHVHPTILSLIIKVGREYGLKSVRVPFEPPLRSWRATGRSLAGKLGWAVFLAPWMNLMRLRLRAAGLNSNDCVFGMADSGDMRADLVIRFLEQIPEGVTEMYFHPATRRCPEIDRTMPTYRHEAEFAALISPDVMRAVQNGGIERIAFSDI
jgi:hopanoid biosynthesis associated protein HpnK